MYGKKKKKKKKRSNGKRKKKSKMGSGGGGGGGTSTGQTAVVINDAAEVAADGASSPQPNNQQPQSQPQLQNSSNQNTKKEIKQRPSLAKRSSSLQEFTVNAPRIAANTAAKLVTGVDMNGMNRSQQQSIRQLEEQEQQCDFVQNSLGQPVYVGSGAAARNRNVGVGQQQQQSSSSPGSGGGAGRASSPINNETETLDEMNLLANVFTAPPPQSVADVGEPVVTDGMIGGGGGGGNNDNNTNDDSDSEYESDSEPNNQLYSHPQDRGNPFLVSPSLSLFAGVEYLLYITVVCL